MASGDPRGVGKESCYIAGRIHHQKKAWLKWLVSILKTDIDVLAMASVSDKQVAKETTPATIVA
jgi:hypothetical protein